MFKMISFIAWCCFTHQLYAQEPYKTLLGLAIPQEMTLPASQPMVLNGAAARSLWGREIYVAALYLAHKSSKHNLIMLTDAPALMKIYWMQDDLMPAEIKQMFTEAMMVNSPELAKSTYDLPRFKEFIAIFERSLNAGDILTVQYLPDNQTVIVVLNNHELHRWTNAKTFFNALLKMWLGEHPPSRQFKQNMLGS